MKPKNNTEVRKAYLRFAGYLTCCTILAVSIFACFLKTSGIEVKRITEQALEYEYLCQRAVPVEQHGLHLPVHETDEHFTANKRQAPAKRCQYAQDEPAQICPRHGHQRLQALQAAAGKPQHLPRGKRLHPSAEYPGRDGEERPDAVHPRQLENKA